MRHLAFMSTMDGRQWHGVLCSALIRHATTVRVPFALPRSALPRSALPRSAPPHRVAMREQRQRAAGWDVGGTGVGLFPGGTAG